MYLFTALIRHLWVWETIFMTSLPSLPKPAAPSLLRKQKENHYGPAPYSRPLFSHLDGHVFYHHGKMKFTDVTGRVYGGTVKASGNYDIDTRAYNIHLAGKKLDSRYPAKDAAIFCYVDLEGDIRCNGNPKEVVSEGTFTSGSGYYKLIPFKK